MRNIFITINGVGMTEDEYKEYRKSKLPKIAKKSEKAKKAKKEYKEISYAATEIEEMVKEIKVLKSLAAYYDHAYKQWGTIANEIFRFNGIRKPFVFYRVKVRELENLVAEISVLSKRNEKAAYQYIEKAAWKLDEIKSEMDSIRNGVNNSGVMYRYKDHECINGNGKRLGLDVLMKRSFSSISKIEKIVEYISRIADEGVDIMNVGIHMSPKERARCWA